jgi:hypothetical protein
VPWWLLIFLVIVAFIGNTVFSCYAARNDGIEAADRLYKALRNSDEGVVKSAVTGFALEQLANLETKYGKVLSYEITDASGKPADMWEVRLRVTRERARTVEHVSNMSSGHIVRFLSGEPDIE